jgi:propionyl-CoA synthetase
MKRIADGATWTMPATIDDPLILDEITSALQGVGYPKHDDAGGRPVASTSRP